MTCIRIPLATFVAMSATSNNLSLAATGKTPKVEIDLGNGTIRITGCSIPENADRFFTPIQDVVERYALAPRSRTSVHIALTYFNSSTSKYLLDLLKRLEDVHSTGRSQVLMEWCYPHGDLDLKEAGEDYRSLVEFPVKLRELDE